jgi:hypothetical protein
MKPAAASSGPTNRGALAPNVPIRPPDQRESVNMSKTNGSNAAPAAVEEYSCTWIRTNGTK